MKKVPQEKSIASDPLLNDLYVKYFQMQLCFLFVDIDAWLFYDGEQVVDELDEMAKGKKSFGFGDKGNHVCIPVMGINLNNINSTASTS